MFKRFLLAGLTLLVMAAQAGAGGDRYGALAYNSDDGSYGWAVDATSQEEADESALEQCGDCEVVMHFQNACAAFATGSGTSYGWAYAGTKEAAQSKALGFCRERGSGCAIKVWACTSR